MLDDDVLNFLSVAKEPAICDDDVDTLRRESVEMRKLL